LIFDPINGFIDDTQMKNNEKFKFILNVLTWFLNTAMCYSDCWNEKGSIEQLDFSMYQFLQPDNKL
jgi:hypothetical protein